MNGAMRCSEMVRAFLLCGILSALTIPACGGGENKAAAPDEWRMVLNHKLETLTIPLDAMNVFLVEDESYPEYFAIEGERTALVGQFPAGLGVGYGEDWKALFGKTIVISPHGGDPADPQDSFVEMPDGVRARVSGGTIVFEKLTGKTAGVDGDLTLSGRVMLIVQTAAGVENLTGTIAVHCVTWG